MSLAQDWPGTAGTHLGHPALVPHGPAQEGEVTSGCPRTGLALPQVAGIGWGGCAGHGHGSALLFLGVMGGPEPAPGRSKGVGTGKEGIFPVLAGAGILCELGAAGQGGKENSDFTRRETGAAGGQRNPGFPEGPWEGAHTSHPCQQLRPCSRHTHPSGNIPCCPNPSRAKLHSSPGRFA